MSQRVPFLKPLPQLQPDAIIVDIHVKVQRNGLMKTVITGDPPPNIVQVVTVLTDCLKSYMDNVNKQASMIIDPNKRQPVNGEEFNVGEETQDNHNG